MRNVNKCCNRTVLMIVLTILLSVLNGVETSCAYQWISWYINKPDNLHVECSCSSEYKTEVILTCNGGEATCNICYHPMWKANEFNKGHEFQKGTKKLFNKIRRVEQLGLDLLTQGVSIQKEVPLKMPNMFTISAFKSTKFECFPFDTPSSYGRDFCGTISLNDQSKMLAEDKIVSSFKTESEFVMKCNDINFVIQTMKQILLNSVKKTVKRKQVVSDDVIIKQNIEDDSNLIKSVVDGFFKYLSISPFETCEDSNWVYMHVMDCLLNSNEDTNAPSFKIGSLMKTTKMAVLPTIRKCDMDKIITPNPIGYSRMFSCTDFSVDTIRGCSSSNEPGVHPLTNDIGTKVVF